MSRKFTTGLIIFLLFVAALVLLSRQFLVSMNGKDGFGGRGDRVALVYVEGAITGDAESGTYLFGGSYVSSVELVDVLEKARKDDDIRAVILRVNSPGGSAAASHEIYEEVVKVDAEKPVVISMGDMCASGGYFISSPARYVLANPSTLTGSIGVIWDSLEYSSLLERYGIRSVTLTAGEYKDIGSSTREMKENERAMLQKMLDQIHEQFINAVAEGRKMEVEEVRKLATGMIYTGENALELKLVDELGGLEAAKIKARELAGLPEDAEVVAYEKKRTVLDIFDMLSAKSIGYPGSSRGLEQPSALETLARRLLLHDIGYTN
jgi:protease-4